jgi:hypothetical protein
VFEHEAEPQVIATRDEAIPTLIDWLRHAHPEWAELLLRACDLTIGDDP